MENAHRVQRVKPLKELAEYLGDLDEKRERNFSHLHETVNNLAVVMGGVAAGALVILSSDVVLSKPPVLLGIIILFADLAFYFVYKISAHVEARDDLSAVSKNIQKPIKELLEMAEDESVSDERFNVRYGANTAIMKNWVDSSDFLKENKLKRPEALCYWTFVVGLFLIALGLIWPYVELLS